jgi:predicted secreted protein
MTLIVSAAAQGAFAGHSLNVAAFGDNAWRFYVPRLGWRAYVESEGLFYVFDGADWVKQRIDLQDVQNLRFAGIGTSADAQNPFSAKLNAALFAARSAAEGGTGDLRFTLNRSQGTNVVSQLYQSNWSGRVETGLMGDDKYRIKVSADGANWKEALSIDPNTGRVNFPNGISDQPAVDPKAQVTAKSNSFLFAPYSVAEGGTGDLRFTLNRSQGTNIVSQLYQSNWSGRAETGLMGDDKYRIKVSADGAVWKDALYADPATGRVFFPNGASDLATSVAVTSGTPAAYILSAPMRGALPDGALFWMVPHVPNATALNVDPTLQIDQIDTVPLPLKAFDGSTLPQGCLEAGKAIAVRKSGAVYLAQVPRSVPAWLNLVEDGGRFAGNPEPVSWAVSTYADVAWITNLNGAVRANYGVARPGTTLHSNIADLLNKIRPAAAQASGSEFFVQQVTAGAGVTLPVTVQSTLHYPVLSSVRNVGRGITAGAYFRVLSGSVVLASSETIPRLLIDGVAHNIAADTPARLFNAASGWKHLQMWLTPVNGSTTSLWPIRATPGTILLFALPSIVRGLETIPWDIGPMPSHRVWR